MRTGFVRHLLPLAAALLLACHAPTLRPAATPKTPAGSMTAAEASSMAREIAPRVERLRGLSFKAPVPVRIVDDATARRHFESRIRKFYTEERLEAYETAYAQLGLLPPGTDLSAEFLAVLEEQAGGYYDPDTDTFYMLDDQPRSAAPVLMAHELTHALDDQHFGIDELAGEVSRDTDRSTALGAVVEGSGTLIMTRFIMEEMQAGRLSNEDLMELQRGEAGRAERLNAAPLLLQRSLLLPYILGQAFLLRGDLARVATAGGEEIDRAFRDLPRSSEQILHPEKYWSDASRDLPVPIDLPDMSKKLGRGWSLAASDSLGEAYLVMLTGAEPLDISSAELMDLSRWTDEAASGWGGDLWHLYVNGHRSASLLATVWDTDRDAREFEEGLVPREGRSSWRRGRAVVLTAGDMPGDAGAIARAVLERLSPGQRHAAGTDSGSR